MQRLLTILICSSSMGCAQWVFHTLGRDCDGITNLIVRTDGPLDLRYDRFDDEQGVDDLGFDASCWVNAEGDGRAPTFRPDSRTLTVDNARWVDVWGPQDLQVELAPRARSTLDFDFGHIEGTGTDDETGVVLLTSSNTLTVDCTSCIVELRPIGRLTLNLDRVRSAVVCTEVGIIAGEVNITSWPSNAPVTVYNASTGVAFLHEGASTLRLPGIPATCLP